MRLYLNIGDTITIPIVIKNLSHFETDVELLLTSQDEFQEKSFGRQLGMFSVQEDTIHLRDNEIRIIHIDCSPTKV